jgi:hypothetical protein
VFCFRNAVHPNVINVTVHPRTGHEGPEGEYGYGSILL